MTRSLRIVAPAKLNLSLHVTGKRDDGYHLLDSLVAFTAFGDELELVLAAELSMSVAGEFAPSLPEDHADNLVLKAARSLQAALGISEGAHIILHKHMPVGSGMGGGSADCAAVLRALPTLWNVTPELHMLARIAESLGADVPMCLLSKPAIVRGVGELVEPVTFAQKLHVLLVHPRVPVLTAGVYQQFAGAFSAQAAHPLQFASADALLEHISHLHNDLEAPACHLLPVIGDIVKAIAATHGCRFARMSGSGSGCFGLYETQEAALSAADHIKTQHPSWWCKATEIVT